MNLETYTPIFLKTFALTFLVSAILFYALYKTRKLKSSNAIKRMFYLSSGKSQTDALLLGGLPLVLGIFTASVYLIVFYGDIAISPQQLNIWKRSLYAGAILTTYGYIDDKFEIRPIAKLVMQFFAIMTFTILTSALLTKSHYSNIVFIVQSIMGMALLNGTNLLDGLDTLSVKLHIGSFLSFIFLGYYYNAPVIAVISISSVAALSAFYMFNRAPAKIYLGEIGGTFIGLTYLALATIFYHNQLGLMARSEILGLALAPMILPISELTISFTRRILANKSPFKGDHLHMHYILTKNKKLSPSMASSLIATINIIGIVIVFSTYFNFKIHSLASLSVGFATIITANIVLCGKFWGIKLKNKIGFDFTFHAIKKKEINIIDLQEVDKFEFTLLLPEADEQIEEETDKKKAA